MPEPPKILGSSDALGTDHSLGADDALGLDEQAELLDVAERSIARGQQGYLETLPDRHWSPRLLQIRATFTTLMIAGELRGCCGTIEPQYPLVHDVWRTAWNSAYADPRFSPVTPDEIASLEVSISVLTPLEPLPVNNDAELIACLRPGRDGLLLQHSSGSATFLPSVWKSLPDPREFLAQLKRKAHWSSEAWPAKMTVLRYGTQTIPQSPTSRLH